MPFGDSAIERAPGTWSENRPIEKPAGSLIRSSGRPAGVRWAASGAEQARVGTRRRAARRAILDFRFWNMAVIPSPLFSTQEPCKDPKDDKDNKDTAYMRLSSSLMSLSSFGSFASVGRLK